jgi:allophanate hydrolase
MLHWSQGLFGFVAHLQPLLDVLRPLSGRHLSSAAQTPPQTPPEWDGDLRISSLQAAYRNGLSPVKVVEAIYPKIEAYNEVNPGAWIYLVPFEDALAAARDLAAKFPDRTALPPLYGVPYTVKDSIDVAGLATTTACPPLSHIATVSAPIHDSVSREGALFIGKANLDQLATGLTGQRSPYGAPSSVFHRSFISGGSSSGSAVLVGARLCSFSLATDTAGSGRVPAAFNGVVGFKPTRGTVPFVGVTPACLSLDCIAVMAATVNDARTVWRAIDGFTTADPYAKRPELRYYSRHVNSIGPAASHFRFGIPPSEALAACSPPYRRCFDETVTRLQQLGGRLHPVDWTPFRAAGALLYDGSFVLERLASIPDLPGNGDGADAATFLARHRADLHPVILDVFDAALARNTSAADVFRDLQTQAALTATVRNTVFCQAAGGVDVLVVPTAPTHFTVTEVAAEPVRRNSLLGTFTHAGNVLDLCGVACPAGKLRAGELVDGEEGELPFGVTFLGGSLTDADVLKIAARFEEAVRADGVI